MSVVIRKYEPSNHELYLSLVLDNSKSSLFILIFQIVTGKWCRNLCQVFLFFIFFNKLFKVTNDLEQKIMKILIRGRHRSLSNKVGIPLSYLLSCYVSEVTMPLGVKSGDESSSWPQFAKVTSQVSRPGVRWTAYCERSSLFRKAALA